MAKAEEALLTEGIFHRGESAYRGDKEAYAGEKSEKGQLLLALIADVAVHLKKGLTSDFGGFFLDIMPGMITITI